MESGQPGDIFLGMAKREALQERLPTDKRKKPKKPRKRTRRCGRPVQLDEKLTEQFCNLIKRGLPTDGCCDYLGITADQFWKWIRKGEQYIESEGEEAELEMYGWFYHSIRKASAAYRLDILDKLHIEDDKYWACWMTILERRDRKTFSRYDQGGGDLEDYDPDERFL